MRETAHLRQVNGSSIFYVVHEANTKRIVIFCHGFRGTSVGPSRSFVDVARKLAGNGISSLRFDQNGSGNSAGDFIDSSFYDWVSTTKALALEYVNQGYEVVLFGQSMGGATVIDVASQISTIKAIVVWVPDPNIDDGNLDNDEIFEEGGQLIKGMYWHEARESEIAKKLHIVRCPAYIVQCANDEYVSDVNHEAILTSAQPNHKVEMFEGYSHSSWTNQQFQEVIGKSTDFIINTFQG